MKTIKYIFFLCLFFFPSSLFAHAGRFEQRRADFYWELHVGTVLDKFNKDLEDIRMLNLTRDWMKNVKN